MTSIYSSGYKVISQCQRAIRSPPSLIIALPQAASHPSSSAGSKQIICQTGRLQLNRRGVGAQAMHNWDLVGKEHAAGGRWPGRRLWDQAASLPFGWRGPVVQDELGPFRTSLELSFLMSRDRPSCTKLLGNRPFCVMPGTCRSSGCIWLAPGWLIPAGAAFYLKESICNPSPRYRLPLCSRRTVGLTWGTRDQIGSKCLSCRCIQGVSGTQPAGKSHVFLLTKRLSE